MQLAVPCLLSDFNASTHTDPIQFLKEQTIVHEQSNDCEQLSTERARDNAIKHRNQPK